MAITAVKYMPIVEVWINDDNLDLMVMMYNLLT